VLVSELDVMPEHILRVFENTVLRRIFVLERGILNGSWKILHNEKLHNCTLQILLG
jgi:hypothetical protein